MRCAKSFNSPVDMEKERLREDLREARRALFGLMPDNIQRILNSYVHCQSSAEGRDWRDKVINELIDLAKIITPQTDYSQARAICPICRRGPNSAYSDGFTIPEGLHRHFEGFGSVQRCSIFSVLLKKADEKLHDMFCEEDEKKMIKEESLKKERMETETLYKISPNDKPELIDGNHFFTPRDIDELRFAEERLVKLKFTVQQDKNVKSYILEMKDVIVYADPRVKKKLEFYVYRLGVVKKSGAKSRQPRYQSFYIPDTWKNDIKDKFKTRLAEARKGLGLPEYELTTPDKS